MKRITQPFEFAQSRELAKGQMGAFSQLPYYMIEIARKLRWVLVDHETG